MNIGYPWTELLKGMTKFGFILTIGVSMNACSKTTWKEEVLLHDGSKIVVERSQVHGGRHEIGQRATITEHSLTFIPPGTDKPIIWKTERSKDIGHDSLSPLALAIINRIPYVVLSPVGCLSYNKWGRPNPPYIVFKYLGEQWKQIAMEELPQEIARPNFLMSTYGHNTVDMMIKSGFVSAEDVKKLNINLTQEEYKSIVRHPLKRVNGDCGKLIYDGESWHSTTDGVQAEHARDDLNKLKLQKTSD